MSDQIIRVLIVDDHMIVRQGLHLVFETEDRIDIVGEAADGEIAVRLASELKPDVILMDLQMPNKDGLTAIQEIRATQPDIAILILTTYNEDEIMVQGLQAGAKGFLLKDTSRADLMHAIQAAARGETLLKPDVMDKLLRFQQQKKTVSPEKGILSERELGILKEVASGATNKQIALKLGISDRTVKAHLTNTYNKFGVDSRAAAIARAAKEGLL
ncbi:MAG: response regulator transcription factor [Anaerolineae bacterium]|jgi:two-component system, NarL family, response regulator YdfI|nr:response regulator transcription factor [Anaerolineae bacterium]MBT7782161.1 response regulator transcription factor [Anaerolineae bacterium]